MKENLELKTIKQFVSNGIIFNNKEETKMLEIINEEYNSNNNQIIHPSYSDLQHKIWICDKLIPTYPNELWSLKKKVY